MISDQTFQTEVTSDQRLYLNTHDSRSDSLQTVVQTQFQTKARPQSHYDQTFQSQVTSDQTLELNKHEILGIVIIYVFHKKNWYVQQKKWSSKTKVKSVEIKVFQKFLKNHYMPLQK